ncbi:hypothetical protein [Oceanospirillum sediminis]|uniref:PilZ domain-containing protein n=1 Tax=Oceanospirillum sediminis TaxID=2760088 RepID=A0A839IQX6_9GAMM|nr:hypothetical protein [Oceanospirillum sediminis]MBB1486899.1 hypothetical protein [Oceanospirillum sediminis]
MNVHWKSRVTRAHKAPYIARTLSVSPKHLHLESEWSLPESEKVRAEVLALHDGKKQVLTIYGKVRSSVLLSTGSSYGLDILIEKISAEDQQFIENYIKARESLRSS